MRSCHRPASQRVQYRRSLIIQYCREAGKVLSGFELIRRLRDRHNQVFGYSTIAADMKHLGLSNKVDEPYPFKGEHR